MTQTHIGQTWADEFTVLLKTIEDNEDAAIVAERILANLAKLHTLTQVEDFLSDGQ